MSPASLRPLLPQSGALPAPAFLEALGCLARLDIPSFDYAGLLRATQLPAFLAGLVAANGAAGAGGGGGGGGSGGSAAERSSVLLAVVEAVGVLCADEACAGVLASAGLVSVRGVTVECAAQAGCPGFVSGMREDVFAASSDTDNPGACAAHC